MVYWWTDRNHEGILFREQRGAQLGDSAYRAKVCWRCSQVLPVAAFHQRPSGGMAKVCDLCKLSSRFDYKREQYLADIEKEDHGKG